MAKGTKKSWKTPKRYWSFFDLWILITPLVSSNSSLSFWPLCCLKDKEELEDTKGVIRIHKSKNDTQRNGQRYKEELEDLFFFDIRILITSLVSSNSPFGHYVVCPSLIYGF
jgi:hypothetical protein